MGEVGGKITIGVCVMEKKVGQDQILCLLHIRSVFFFILSFFFLSRYNCWMFELTLALLFRRCLLQWNRFLTDCAPLASLRYWHHICSAYTFI
jgi:hypothetical protein